MSRAENTYAPSSVPSFPEVDVFAAALAFKGEPNGPDLYPRDGFQLLTQAETQASAIARVDPTQALLFTSGMMAVRASLEVATRGKKTAELTIASPPQLYSQSTAMLEFDYKDRGASLVLFKPGSGDHIEKVIEEKRPDVIVAETVGNEPNVAVLALNRLLEAARRAEHLPTVILDNTLPLSTGLPLGEILTPDDNVIVVESATKMYADNREIAGTAYSRSPELLQALRQWRRRNGAGPGIGSTERVLAFLPRSVEEFDERNRNIFKATGELALWLAAAEEDGAPFKVAHPILPNHPNHDTITKELPQGTSPVVYLTCHDDIDQRELATKLWSNPEVKKQADLGQSFGLDRARILLDRDFPTVRIAGGATTIPNALGAALYIAATS